MNNLVSVIKKKNTRYLFLQYDDKSIPNLFFVSNQSDELLIGFYQDGKMKVIPLNLENIIDLGGNFNDEVFAVSYLSIEKLNKIIDATLDEMGDDDTDWLMCEIAETIIKLPEFKMDKEVKEAFKKYWNNENKDK